MDLFKAFDTLNHELLVSKLNAYGFSHDSLRLLYSYLSTLTEDIFAEDIFAEFIFAILPLNRENKFREMNHLWVDRENKFREI